jgi:hypothetical protein
MRGVGHVAFTGNIRKANKIVILKPGGKTPFSPKLFNDAFSIQTINHRIVGWMDR